MTILTTIYTLNNFHHVSYFAIPIPKILPNVLGANTSFSDSR